MIKRSKWGTRWYALSGVLELGWVYLMFIILIVLLPAFALYRWAASQLHHRGYL